MTTLLDLLAQAKELDEQAAQVHAILSRRLFPDGRRRMPSLRPSINHRYQVGNCSGYLVVGLFPDGTPGEIFVVAPGALGGLLDAWATQWSVARQQGASLAKLLDKGIGHRFEPAGWTDNPSIGYAYSLIDYISLWIAKRFGIEPWASMPARSPRQIELEEG